MKNTGVLCPISSLPGRYGIGDFGQSAYQFIDKLSAAHVKIWQILPLNPLAYGNSPYQPYSSFAGDEIYISLHYLKKDGLLKEEEVEYFNQDTTRVAYDEVRAYKEALFKKAFSRFEPDDEFREFEATHDWLDGYVMYRVFKNHNKGLDWTHWEKDYKEYPQKQAFPHTLFDVEMMYQKFLQFYFFKQWMAIKRYANERDILIIGDMPIYVGLDSADVWLNQENFLLEEDGSPSFVAGVPPDYFAKYGQRWGNPIYDWDYLKAHDFDFWCNRLGSALQLYNVLRIDHFRGFDTYWKIPASEPTAVIGEWVEAPGYDLFDTFFKKYPDANILAEDLGELRDEVYELRDHYHFKGMFIYQFHHMDDTFDLDKVIVYTGTHDNDTLASWLTTIDKKEMKIIEKETKDYDEKLLYRKVIHYCLDMDVDTIIVPAWDLMGLPGECRFNTLGTIGEPNWMWRMSDFSQFDAAMDYFAQLITETGRD